MRHLAIGLLTCLCWACGGDQPAPDTGLPKADLFPSLPDHGAVGGCSRGSCSGCCRDGECLDGMDPRACGLSGQACITCGPGATCPAGICAEPDCDAATCKGCCAADGRCADGRAPDACGTGGAACASCTAEQGCVAQQCVDKGPPMHKVTLVSSKISGSSLVVCGFAEFSACDLYVIVKVGSATATSTIVDNSDAPAWNEYLLTALDSELTTRFAVEVRDDDPVGSVQVGACTPAVTQETLDAGQLVTDCGGAKDLTFSFQPI